MTRVVIVGYKGRMGQAVLSCAALHTDLEVVGQVDQGDDLQSVITRADVLIDFSFHDATVGVAELCVPHQKALVIGTTGHDDAEKARITKAKSHIPIVWASNYSTGVNALFWLTRKAAEILGPDFDLEVVEMHHRMKKDAPGGTATTLAEMRAEARKQQPGKVIRHGRQGIVGERTPAEIGMH